MVCQLKAYYLFEILSEEARTRNKIRSKARLDCTQYFDPANRLQNFISKKGQLYFYLTDTKHFINASTKRIADWALTNTRGNLTSLYIEDMDCKELAYGYPNKNKPNKFSNDGYLFVIHNDYKKIELFIIPGGRNYITGYYQELIDGGFNDCIADLRSKAKTFFNY